MRTRVSRLCPTSSIASEPRSRSKVERKFTYLEAMVFQLEQNFADMLRSRARVFKELFQRRMKADEDRNREQEVNGIPRSNSRLKMESFLEQEDQDLYHQQFLRSSTSSSSGSSTDSDSVIDQIDFSSGLSLRITDSEEDDYSYQIDKRTGEWIGENGKEMAGLREERARLKAQRKRALRDRKERLYSAGRTFVSNLTKFSPRRPARSSNTQYYRQSDSVHLLASESDSDF